MAISFTRTILHIAINLHIAIILAVIVGETCHADGNRLLDVIVQDVNGKTHSGELSVVDGKQLVLNGKTKTSLALRDVFRVDFHQKSQANQPLGTATILLSTGDRIAVSPTKIDGDDLHGFWVNLPGKLPARIPLMAVRAMILQQPETRRGQRRLAAAIAGHKKLQDELILRNGDRVSGRLDSLDDSGAKITGTTSKIRRSEIRAVLFNPKYVQQPKPADKAIRLQLTDGSQFAARHVTFLLPDALEVVPFFGGKVKIPVSALSTIQFLGDRITALSDRKPAVYEFTPYLSGDRPLQRNRNVLGGPLTLRGRIYGVGLGMHSRSRLTYELTQADSQFLATVGIDDAAKGKGHAVFLVELDGKPVHKSPVLTGKSPPHRIGPIPLTGHKRLTLIVDYGPFGDVLDYADWCDAVLIGK